MSVAVTTVRWVNELQAGHLFAFADWPDERVPRRAAGVYTVWRREEFIYVGMSGRGAQLEDFVVPSGLPDKAKGLWTRLNSHASGRRAGDQFNVYLCDRFIVPYLTSDQRRDISVGRLLLDQMTKNFVRGELSYRFLVCRSGAEALAIERDVRSGGLPAGPPFLNPL